MKQTLGRVPALRTRGGGGGDPLRGKGTTDSAPPSVCGCGSCLLTAGGIYGHSDQWEAVGTVWGHVAALWMVMGFSPEGYGEVRQWAPS